MKKSNGFTLTELIITMAIAGILAAIAIPSYQTLVLNNQQASQLEILTSSIIYARSEALKRSGVVSLCSSADGSTCAASANWEQGWIIFVDSDSDGVFDAGEELLKVSGSFAGASTLKSYSFADTDFLSFRANGTTGSSSGQFLHCDKRGDSHAREVTVNITGRTKVIASNLTNSCP